MTTRDLERSSRDLSMFVAHYLSQWLEIETQLQWSTYRKWLPGVSNGHVTCDVT